MFTSERACTSPTAPFVFLPFPAAARHVTHCGTQGTPDHVTSVGIDSSKRADSLRLNHSINLTLWFKVCGLLSITKDYRRDVLQVCAERERDQITEPHTHI